MIKRYIVLPDGSRCELGEYVKSWKALLILPESTRINGFDWIADTTGAILNQLRDGLDDRINHHISWFNVGRKWRLHRGQCGWDYAMAYRHKLSEDALDRMKRGQPVNQFNNRGSICSIK